MKLQSVPGNRSRNIIFILVVGASYISTAVLFGYSQWHPSLTKLPFMIGAAAAYLLVGIYGFERCRQSGKLSTALLYFLIQLTLAATLLFLTQSFAIALAMLPLASQCVELVPTAWAIAICGGIILVIVTPLGLRNGFRAAAVSAFVLLTFLVIVVASTYIVVRERRARTEIERLAAELGEANTKLREYTAKVEELATIKERNRLAREIHDSLGHYLTIINMQLEAAQAVMGSHEEQARDVLNKAQALAQDGLVDVRQSVA